MPQNMGMGEAGVADIIGVYKGRGFAIEVKAPGGAPTPWQLRFLNDWDQAGGAAFVARSVQAVREMFQLNGVEVP